MIFLETLSFRYANEVLHFKILRETRLGLYYLWAKRFGSINELIDYHR